LRPDTSGWCIGSLKMPHKLQALDLWRNVLVSSVRQAGPDLSSRQLALLLTVYLTPPPHTVRGLASTLNISKPAISRALDRLGRLGFIRRKRDDADRRNVLVQRTVKGSVFLTEFSQLLLVSQQATMAEAGALDNPPSQLPQEASNDLVLTGP
jgi:DNA-binding MarR family transcriptional regulator